jgi:hypothetical protein
MYKEETEAWWNTGTRDFRSLFKSKEAENKIPLHANERQHKKDLTGHSLALVLEKKRHLFKHFSNL